jgi:hypothetical protein
MMSSDLSPRDLRQMAIEESVASVTARLGLVSDSNSVVPPAYTASAGE